MPAVDNILVKTLNWRATSPIVAPCGVLPFEVGAKGDVVKLHSLHLIVDHIPTFAVDAYWGCALSSNPEHEIAPPINYDTLFETPSLYGFTGCWYQRFLITTGAAYGGSASEIVCTKETNLHGIIRPRHQVFLFWYVNATQSSRFRCEIYYEAVKVPKEIEDHINLKYGLYRRS